MASKKQFETIDEYIRNISKKHTGNFRKNAESYKKSSSESEEAISYGMPAFKLNGVLVYFAAYKNI